jgi:hypothetical protein
VRSSFQQNKKTKDVYIISKTKWYGTATREEVESLRTMVLDGEDMETKHRIIQHVIR